VSEKSDLLASIAKTISGYRAGEIVQPADHVGRWAGQFTSANLVPFLREFDHVIRQSYLTEKVVGEFLAKVVSTEKLAGKSPKAYWSRANFLRIQKAGQSQKSMLGQFGSILLEQFGLNIAKCGSDDGDFIYLDDVIFSGGRVGDDLKSWIIDKAPNNANVHVIVLAYYRYGEYSAKNNVQKAIREAAKNIRITYWRLHELENRKFYKDSSDVLWPTTVPQLPDVEAYVASEKRFPLEPRKPGGPLGMFSSEHGRQILESEFLIAGVKIRSLTQTPKDVIRPLGLGHFGVGFGSLIATYRNCPNNCPLGIWWGDPKATSGALHWYPLLPRKTYASAENCFNAF